MNIWDERCKSFITCLSPFCDWSCQFLHGQQDVKPNNSCQVQAFQDCLWANFQQFSNWFQFLLFEMMLVQTRMRYIVKLLYFLVCHFTISFNTFLSMSFHVVGPRHCMCLRFLPSRYFLCSSSKNTWFEHFCTSFNDSFSRFAFTLSASRTHVIKKWVWFVKINVSSSISSTWEPDSVSFLRFFKSSTYINRNNPCFWWTNIHSQFGTFSHSSSNKTSSNCLSHKRPANGCPYKFRSRGIVLWVDSKQHVIVQ